MIYLNLLNRIFGPKKPLSRKEIDALKSGKASHETERKAEDDGFNAEAMEGWSTVETDVESTMHSLDKKVGEHLNESHGSQDQKNIYFFLGAFTLVMLVLVMYTYQGNKLSKETIAQTTPVNDDKQSTPLESDQSIEKKEPIEEQIAAIDSYTPITRSEQITKEQLKKKTNNPVESSQEKQNEEENSGSHTEIEELSPKPLEEVASNESTSLSYSTVHEVYLNSLKTVDYRVLREEKKIKLLKELPIGTPANQANPDDETISTTETLTKEVNYIDYLDETQRLFAKESFKRALRRYLIILDHYPDDVNAHFYSGLCYHNLGRYEKAIEHFDKSYSLPIGNFKEEAEWFKAKALIKTNNKAKATQLLKTIKKEGGFYSEQAEELLNSL